MVNLQWVVFGFSVGFVRLVRKVKRYIKEVDLLKVDLSGDL